MFSSVIKEEQKRVEDTQKAIMNNKYKTANTYKEQNFNSGVQQSNGSNNTNVAGILVDRAIKILNNKTQKLQDEVYFQICKLIEGNTNQNALTKIYQFAIIFSGLFAPS